MERHREGAWAFFRLSDRGAASQILHPMLDALDRADPQLADDRARLSAVRAQRAEAAQSFFARLAPDAGEAVSGHGVTAAAKRVPAE